MTSGYMFLRSFGMYKAQTIAYPMQHVRSRTGKLISGRPLIVLVAPTGRLQESRRWMSHRIVASARELNVSSRQHFRFPPPFPPKFGVWWRPSHLPRTLARLQGKERTAGDGRHAKSEANAGGGRGALSQSVIRSWRGGPGLWSKERSATNT